MSTPEARKLVFRVASDPALLRRFSSVADRAEKDPTACAQLARMIAELDPKVTIKECQEVRAELGDHRSIDALRTALPDLDHDQVALAAKNEGMDALAWVRRAAHAVANLCSA